MRGGRFLVGILLALLAAVLLAATRLEPAHASFPGKNGEITFVGVRGGNHDIYVVHPDGSQLRRLTDHPAWDQEPAFSPDGVSVAFSSYRGGYRDLYVVKADGSGLKNLTNNAGSADDWYTGGISSAWSPNGRKIAFIKEGSGYAQHALFLMNSSGSGQKLLRSFPTGTYLGDLEWSPDGTKIVFRSYRYPEEGSRISTVNADGSELITLTSGLASTDFSPTWSPNGKKIAFGRRDDRTDVYVMNADGSGVTNLTNGEGSGSGSPTWSPDGTKIAFQRGREIYTMNTDGSGKAPLTRGPVIGASPDWGPLALAPPDTAPPDTRLISGASGHTKNRAAVFHFESTEPGSTFRCKLDGGRYEKCSSPHSYRKLADGPHIFRVRAIDSAGNVDPTLAVRRWVVSDSKPRVVGPVPGFNKVCREVLIAQRVRGWLRHAGVRCRIDGRLGSFVHHPRAVRLVYSQERIPSDRRAVRRPANNLATDRGVGVRGSGMSP